MSLPPSPPRATPSPEVAADYQSLRDAANWYAELAADGSPTQQAAWQDWLQQRPEHQRAWEHVQAVSRRFQPLRADGGAPAVAGYRAGYSRRSRRGALTTLGIGLVALTSGWAGWRYTALPFHARSQWAAYRTGTGEQRQLTLPDGTQVWLNTRTALDVDYSSRTRQLTLALGEILIDTALDPDGRPFVVVTPHGELQALGTRFTVWLTPEATDLHVYDGAVALRATHGASLTVPAGAQARTDGTQLWGPSPADPARQTWTRGVLVAQEQPLGNLIQELARHRPGYLDVDPAVAELRVMGVYPTHNTDQALAMLARNLPVQVRQIMPWWTVVEPR